MSDLAIGIDLGTSTSVVSFIRDGSPVSIPDPITKTPIVPSVVARNRKGELVVGEAALSANVAPGSLIREAKRAMGTDETFTAGDEALRAEEVAALVLRKMIQNAEGYLGSNIEKAVITVPAYFGDLERRATMQAAQLAGIDVIRLISEPTAAAMAYGHGQPDSEEVLMVFDLGGGTLDVTILEMLGGVLDVKTSSGDKELGGKDMDAAIMAWASDAFAKANPGANIGPRGPEALKRAAEDAKKSLSEQDQTDLFVENYATSGGAEVDLDLTLSRPQFESLIAPLTARMLQVIDEALRKANLSPEHIDRVLLVGGGTYVPIVRQTVEAHLRRPTLWNVVNPDLAVSQGAALSAALSMGAVDSATSIILQDASTYGLGILVMENVGHQEMLVYAELMAPGTPVPFLTRKQFTLRYPDQTEMEIEVVQDPSGLARLPQDTVPTGATGVVADIPIAMYGAPHRVEVEFSYDQNHIAQLTANILGTGKSCTIKLTTGHGMMDEKQMLAATTRIDALWESSPLASRHTSLIRRAEKVLEDRPANAESIQSELTTLKSHVAGNNAEGAQAARNRLTDLLAEL